MSKFPNPFYAFVELSVGDMDLSVLPPQHVQQFTYVRKPHNAANKFTIVLFDETALLVEAQLAKGYKDIKFKYGYVDGSESPVYKGMATQYDIDFNPAGCILTLEGMSNSIATFSNPKSAVYKDKTIDQIVTDIAKEEGWKVGVIEPCEPISDGTKPNRDFMRNNQTAQVFIVNDLIPYAKSANTGDSGFILNFEDNDSGTVINFYPKLAAAASSDQLPQNKKSSDEKESDSKEGGESKKDSKKEEKNDFEKGIMNIDKSLKDINKGISHMQNSITDAVNNFEGEITNNLNEFTNHLTNSASSAISSELNKVVGKAIGGLVGGNPRNPLVKKAVEKATSFAQDKINDKIKGVVGKYLGGANADVNKALMQINNVINTELDKVMNQSLKQVTSTISEASKEIKRIGDIGQKIGGYINKEKSTGKDLYELAKTGLSVKQEDASKNPEAPKNSEVSKALDQKSDIEKVMNEINKGVDQYNSVLSQVDNAVSQVNGTINSINSILDSTSLIPGLENCISLPKVPNITDKFKFDKDNLSIGGIPIVKPEFKGYLSNILDKDSSSSDKPSDDKNTTDKPSDDKNNTDKPSDDKPNEDNKTEGETKPADNSTSDSSTDKSSEEGKETDTNSNANSPTPISTTHNYEFQWGAGDRNSKVLDFNPDYSGTLCMMSGGATIDSSTIDRITNCIVNLKFNNTNDPKRVTLEDRSDYKYEGATRYIGGSAQSYDEMRKTAAYLWYSYASSPVNADMTIMGDPAINAFDTVSIVMLNKDGLPHHSSGLYCIKEVEDDIAGGSFTTKLTLFRNAMKIGVDKAGGVNVNLIANLSLGSRSRAFGGGGGNDLVRIALAEEGYTEGAGGYTKYGAWYGSATDDWCAMFISWCANQAGISNSIIPKENSAPNFYQFYAGQSRWTFSRSEGGPSSYIPQEGDIVVFNWSDSKGDGPDHVGIVVDCDGSTVTTIEGNSSNMVKKKEYSIDFSDFYGFGTPDYGVGPIDGFDCDSSNVEGSCFNFLTQAMGYNVAAACGALANIRVESDGFQVDIEEYGGGGGYGLIQWTATRNTRLKSWCPQNGYDYTTLEGQLAYLQYEMINYYGGAHEKLLAVSDDANGCREAAIVWCSDFEGPEDLPNEAYRRADIAINEFYPKYGG